MLFLNQTMKKTLLSFIIICSVQLVSAQSYTVTNIGNKYSQNEIDLAFTGFNFCGYVFENQPNILRFDDGTEISIASKAEFNTIGVSITEECIKDPNHMAGESEVWYIKDGFLVREITPLFKNN
jgi:hypothetical protein